MDQKVIDIVSRALEGNAPSFDEAIYLLSLDEKSPEATLLRGAANDIVRGKTGNSAIIYGQIGVDVYPCEADCQFCSFGRTHTLFDHRTVLDNDTILEKAREFTKDGDLFGMWIMTMNSFDRDWYLGVIEMLRKAIPASTNLYANIGDCDEGYWRELKAAGLAGAYHVLRLGEGEVTKIDPATRKQTMRAIMNAGLDLQDCCEPIGPEHTPQQIAEHLFETVKKGCVDSSAMKRTPVPGTIFEGPAITNLRLAQIVAVNALVMLAVDPYPWIGVHEANPIGLVSGANNISAETGVNPRDTAADTSHGGRGLDVAACREMLYQAGFDYLVRGDGSKVALTAEYLRRCEENR
ncbi:MAG: hypothetical protein U0L71_05585 [Eggerthellaceae bacterium]|nr:hypothetical protein [Eggerthellaceae bacterium]